MFKIFREDFDKLVDSDCPLSAFCPRRFTSSCTIHGTEFWRAGWCWWSSACARL